MNSCLLPYSDHLFSFPFSEGLLTLTGELKRLFVVRLLGVCALCPALLVFILILSFDCLALCFVRVRLLLNERPRASVEDLEERTEEYLDLMDSRMLGSFIVVDMLEF